MKEQGNTNCTKMNTTQTLDKELETIQIKESQIFAKDVTVLRFAAMDVVIDTKNMEIIEEIVGSMDTVSTFTSITEFKADIASHIWMFNN